MLRRLAGAVAAMAMLAGCASHRAPDLRPAPHARVEAQLVAIPRQTIAGNLVMFDACLIDPEAEIRCPSLEWTRPDGTRSSHTADCDPDERVTRHCEIQYADLARGDNEVGIVFLQGGQHWSARVVVPVH